jgi:hypothetical protein
MLFANCVASKSHQSNAKDVVRLIAKMVICTKVMEWLALCMLTTDSRRTLCGRISKNEPHNVIVLVSQKKGRVGAAKL